MPESKRSGLSKGRIYALQAHIEAQRDILMQELEMLFDSNVPVIPQHTNYFDAVEDKLHDLAAQDGALDALNTHFKED